MRKLLLSLLTGVLIIMQAGTIAAEKSSLDISGNWLGVLKVPGAELRLVLKVTKNADGSFSSKLDSIDQGANDIPVAQTILKDGKVHLDLPVIQGTFDGTLNEAGTEITGEWKQGTAFPLIFKRTAEVVELRRPQEPKPPFPYNEEEVSYLNQAAGIRLAGTLTTPKEKGPFPAVILITGSGAQDRNETLMNHKPFWVIADYLTRRGIAVLRVDDRGIGGTSGRVDQSTSPDFAGDVLAGVEFLKSRKDINLRQIGLIGHSEGGIVAPMAAVRSKDVAFIILLAGPGLSGEEIIRKQSDLIIRAGGGTDKDLAAQQGYLENIFAICRMNEPEARKIKLHEYAEQLFSGMSDTEKQATGNSPAVIEAQLQSAITPWYRFFIDYDPVPTLKKVTCPVLALNGSKDLQVPPKEDLAAIANALKEAGNRDYTVKELPNLNHLFQNCETGSPTEYGKIEETFSPDALKIMGDWIVEHTRER